MRSIPKKKWKRNKKIKSWGQIKIEKDKNVRKDERKKNR